MKNNFLHFLLLGCACGLFAVSQCFAQDKLPYSENSNQTDKQNRPNIIRELDLSPDQFKDIRRLNQQRKPLMQAAQERQRLANQRLDEAIYADNYDEQEVQNRLREMQTAHSEILKIRTGTESSIRRLLTADQLIKFRQLRQNFAQPNDRPINRPLNRQNSLPPDNPLQNRIRRNKGFRNQNRQTGQ